MPAVEKFSELLPHDARTKLENKIAHEVTPGRFLYTTGIDGYDVIIRQLFPTTHLPSKLWDADDNNTPPPTIAGNYCFNYDYFVRPITGEILHIPFADWDNYVCKLVPHSERERNPDLGYFWYRPEGSDAPFQPPNSEVLMRLKLDAALHFDAQSTHGLIKAMRLLVPVVEHLAEQTNTDPDTIATIKSVCGELSERHNFVDAANRKIQEQKLRKSVDFENLLAECEAESKAADTPHDTPAEEIPAYDDPPADSGDGDSNG